MTEAPEKNPFLDLKTRSLLWWCLAGSVVLSILLRSEPLLEYGIYAVILLWAWWQIRRLGISTQRLVGTLPRDSAWIPRIAFLTPMILMFSVGAWLVYFKIISLVAPSAAKVAVEVASQPIPWVLGVLVGPPIEELIFRGMLLHRWSLKWGLRKAIVLSSVAFALLHANPLGTFVFGYVMAVIYIRSRTLIVPIACHMLNNALVLALVASLKGVAPSTSSFNTVTALCAIGSGAWLWYFLRRNWPAADWRAPYFAASNGPVATLRTPDAGAVEGEDPAEHPDPLPYERLGAGELPPGELPPGERPTGSL